MYYIQESDKPCKILKFLNCIRLKDNEIILPIQKEELTDKQAEKLATKTYKVIRTSNCKKIVVSKEIKKQKQYLNYLYSFGLDIVEGKWLFQILSNMSLEYICKKNNLLKSEISISILANQVTENVIYFLKKIVKEYKRVNIVTNNIGLFKNLETQIMEQYGVMIVVTNNKRKSLSKSQLIVNFDFPTELINKYNIYEDAVILNLQDDVKIKSKRYNGICINDYEIVVLNGQDFDYSKVQKFYCKDLYECNLYKKQPIDKIVRKINSDGVRIEKLYTNRGNEI